MKTPSKPAWGSAVTGAALSNLDRVAGVFERIVGWGSGSTFADAKTMLENFRAAWNDSPFIGAASDLVSVVSFIALTGMSLVWAKNRFFGPVAANATVPELERRFIDCKLQLTKRLAECPTGTKSRDKAERWLDKAKLDILDYLGQARLDDFISSTSFPTKKDPPREARAIECAKHWLEKELARIQPVDIRPPTPTRP